MAKSCSMALVIVMVAAAAMLYGSAAQTVHVVGDSTGWTIPPGSNAYSNWARQKTFSVGDVLVFRFAQGAHDVAEVSKAGFDACNATSPISQSTNSPANMTLRTAGEHYYICRFPGHCGLGQKLAINVSAASSSSSPAPQPSSAATPLPSAAPATAPAASAPETSPPAASPAPSAAGAGGPKTYTVGDRLGWTVPTGPAAYQTWARNKNFKVGDTLVFNFVSGAHNVAEVSKSSFDSCNTTSPMRTITTSPARITIAGAGEHYYICSFPGHCSLGQKLSVKVSASAAAPSSGPSAATPTPSTIANTPSGSTVPSAESPANSPPSPNAAAPAVALPITLLSAAALAFLF